MDINLKGRSLLALADYTPDEIRYLLDVARMEKREKKAGSPPTARFSGKSLAILFEKRSTRTRCSFETAFAEDGGHPVFLSTQDIHLGAKETIEDTARVLGRMFDAIAFRGFLQTTVEALAENAGIPVYNGLTDLWHPTQVLADLMTVQEAFGELQGRHLVYLGDGRNNTARSLLMGCSLMGLGCTVAAPESLQPDGDLVAQCRKQAEQNGVVCRVTTDPLEGVEQADVIYTDVWVSMGEERKERERLRILGPYQVNASLMGHVKKPSAIFFHDLPAVRGNEVTADVFEGPRSRVWDQAENRKHTIKALMLATL